MQLSQPTLEPHSLCYTCWVQVVYSHLPPLLFFLLFFLWYSTVAQFLPMRGSSPRATRSTRTSRRSSPSRRPVVPSFDESLRICFYASAVSDIFVIHVINNIRTRFIISFYVYMCDLILARIWLLGLCPFINRVLQSIMMSTLFEVSFEPLQCDGSNYYSWSKLVSSIQTCDASYQKRGKGPDLM